MRPSTPRVIAPVCSSMRSSPTSAVPGLHLSAGSAEEESCAACNKICPLVITVFFVAFPKKSPPPPPGIYKMGFMVFHRDCFHEYVPLLCGKEDEMSESVSHFKLSKKKKKWLSWLCQAADLNKERLRSYVERKIPSCKIWVGPKRRGRRERNAASSLGIRTEKGSQGRNTLRVCLWAHIGKGEIKLMRQKSSKVL